MARAEEIFRIGESLPVALREAAGKPTVRLAVGLSDGLSKFAAHRLLEPILGTPALRLVCTEGDIEHLVAELALHRLDLVLTGAPAPHNPDLRLTSQRLIGAPVDWYGPASIVNDAAIANYPGALETLPVLLPSRHSPLRVMLERWFESQGLRPTIVGEFEDSALLAVFATRGLGVFPVSRLGADEVGLFPGTRRLGSCQGVVDEIYALRSGRGLEHPLVLQIIEAASM